MKIIHCADLHLDSKMETHLSFDQAKSRRYEILETFAKMVRYAQKEGIGLILIAGDMFDTPANRQRRIKDRVLEIIRDSPDIDFLYLQGNHDSDAYFKTMVSQPANLKLFANQPQSYRYKNLVVTGLEFDNKNPMPDPTDLKLDPEDFNIVLLHGLVGGANSHQRGTINLGLWQERNIDYLALGHLHDYHQGRLDQRGVYCYPGCLEGRGFDETGIKGFVVLDVAAPVFTSEFVSLAKRRFFVIRVNLEACPDTKTAWQKMEQALKDVSGADLVRIILVGQVSEEFDLDCDYLDHQLQGRFYFFELVNQLEIAIDYQSYAFDISLKGEFVSLVGTMAGDGADKQQIIKLALAALAHKEVDL